VAVDFKISSLPEKCLILRPPALAVGLGCHRDCPFEELSLLLSSIFGQHNLSMDSLTTLATVDRRGHPELAPAILAKSLNLPLLTYGSDRLAAVSTPNPSETVLRRIGAASVCEASAILAARMGQLIVPKTKTSRATGAVALINYS
jgi:cobalt-precorrin 5A hydrolase